MLAELRRLFPLLDPANLSPFLDAIKVLLAKYGAASRALGEQSYLAAREASGVPGRFKVPEVALPSDDAVEASVRWATYAPGEGGEAPATAQIEHRIEGASLRHMRQPERETIATAVTHDPRAKQWQRIPEGAYTCSFCMLLCMRGAIYESEAAAGGRNARGKRNADAGKKFIGAGRFKFHDHCDCTVIPVFEGDDEVFPESVKRAEQIYNESTGKSHGTGKLRAFRNAYEAEAGRSDHHKRKA